MKTFLKKWLIIFTLFLFNEIILWTARIFWLIYSSAEINIKFSNFIFFDVASFGITFGLLIFIIILANRKFLLKYSGIISAIFFGVPAYITIFLNFSDVFYYEENHKRLTYEIFTMFRELMDSFSGIFWDYSGYIISVFVWIVILTVIFRKILLRILNNSRDNPFYLRIINLLLFVGIMIFTIRGGLRYKPITIEKAFEGVNDFQGNWHLNTNYVLANYLFSGKIQRINFLPEETAINILRKHSFSPAIDSIFISRKFPVEKLTKTRPEKKYNVVIFIIESLGKEYLTPEYTPFLYNLQNKSIVFSNHYSNAVRSIESIPALFPGLPNIFDFSLIGSPYGLIGNNNVAKILKTRGYTTVFFHGAKRGSMGFLSYTKALGFEKYYGMEDFPNYEKFYDGNWGIYDHYFMEFFYKKLAEQNKPFLATLFTLSNHQPYSVPETFGENGNFKTTLKYTDYAIKLFFDKVKNEEWYKNTIFIFTADHYTNFEHKDLTYQQLHEVPFFIFLPGQAPQKITNTTSHLNLTPTLIDLLGINTKYSSFVPSALDTSANHYAIFRRSNSIVLVKDSLSVEYEAVLKKYYFKKKTGSKWQDTTPYKHLKTELQALYQSINNIILENKYYDE